MERRQPRRSGRRLAHQDRPGGSITSADTPRTITTRPVDQTEFRYSKRIPRGAIFTAETMDHVTDHPLTTDVVDPVLAGIQGRRAVVGHLDLAATTPQAGSLDTRTSYWSELVRVGQMFGTAILFVGDDPNDLEPIRYRLVSELQDSWRVVVRLGASSASPSDIRSSAITCNLVETRLTPPPLRRDISIHRRACRRTLGRFAAAQIDGSGA
jgi:hypothetical protein